MYYFAYGSNMVIEQMRRLCGRHCSALGKAELPNYEFGLDLRGFANIRPSDGEKVCGVLWEVDQEALEALDKFEGVPSVFDRKKVAIVDDQGRNVEAWVYVEPVEQFGGDHPRMEYFNRVLSGARENNLPEEWITKIQHLVNI